MVLKSFPHFPQTLLLLSLNLKIFRRNLWQAIDKLTSGLLAGVIGCASKLRVWQLISTSVFLIKVGELKFE